MMLCACMHTFFCHIFVNFGPGVSFHKVDSPQMRLQSLYNQSSQRCISLKTSLPKKHKSDAELQAFKNSLRNNSCQFYSTRMNFTERRINLLHQYLLPEHIHDKSGKSGCRSIISRPLN